HIGVFGLDQALFARGRFIFAHDPPLLRSQSAPACRAEAQHDRRRARGRYFSACNASYSARDQPAPALASLCSGIAALRNASRSTSTTVLPSLRSWSAIFCSEARISSEALDAACART